MLDRVSLSLRAGEKVGVVGDNGAGKSTLLRLLAGEERPDRGDLTVVAPGGIGYLAQSLVLPSSSTVQDAVDLALSELRALESALRRAELDVADAAPGVELTAALASYAQLTEQYDARDPYAADARVEAALHGLGLPGLSRERRLATLSGGERSRLALASTLAVAARAAAARRADQRPRRQRRGLAGGVPAGAPRHGRRGHARPRLPRADHHHHPRGRRWPRLTPRQRLRRLPRRQGRATPAAPAAVRRLARRARTQPSHGRERGRPARRHPTEGAQGRLRARRVPDAQPRARDDEPHPQRQGADRAAHRRPGLAATGAAVPHRSDRHGRSGDGSDGGPGR